MATRRKPKKTVPSKRSPALEPLRRHLMSSVSVQALVAAGAVAR